MKTILIAMIAGLLGCGDISEANVSLNDPDAGTQTGAGGASARGGGAGTDPMGLAGQPGAGGRGGAPGAGGTWTPPPGGGTTGSAGATGRGGTTGSAGATGTKPGGALCATSAECTYGPCVAGGCTGRVCRTSAECLNGDICNDGLAPFDYCANTAPAGGCSCGHGW